VVFCVLGGLFGGVGIDRVGVVGGVKCVHELHFNFFCYVVSIHDAFICAT